MDPKTQGQIRINTPAKITPWLRVARKRSDGFHQVQIILIPVSLFDALELALEQQPGIRLEVSGADLGNDQDNLVFRAVKAIETELGGLPGLRIHLEKRIPHGAGLGGGSGNAAGTLLALNRLLGSPLQKTKLSELAAGLGSDVPFFLDPRPALAEGRGEILRPLSGFPSFSVLVVSPPFSMSTRKAYGMLNPLDSLSPPPVMDSPASVLSILENHFEQPLLEQFPELGNFRQELVSAGASGVLLSGSGTSLFALFENEESLQKAMGQLHLPEHWKLFPCATIAHYHYW